MLNKFIKYIETVDWDDSSLPIYKITILKSEHNVLNPTVQIFKDMGSFINELIEPEYLNINSVNHNIEIGALQPITGKILIL